MKISSSLMLEIRTILDRLPKNIEIYVICAKGGSSEFVAQQIAEEGFIDVYSVEGGMKAWSEHLEPVKIGELKNGGAIYQFDRLINVLNNSI
jgi:rhodanese-related sulfurtransferase